MSKLPIHIHVYIYICMYRARIRGLASISHPNTHKCYRFVCVRDSPSQRPDPRAGTNYLESEALHPGSSVPSGLGFSV